LDLVINLSVKLQVLINQWWPWIVLWDDIFYIQFFIICTYTYIYVYKNIFQILVYVFINFFLTGIYLSIFQIDLFTAFLWLIECSVLFVFLLLLFYLNIKCTYGYTSNQNQNYLVALYIFVYFILLNVYSNSDNFCVVIINFYNTVDNYYEALYNNITNDLFGFSISYYLLNSIEFILIGFLLLVGSVVCVNLYAINKGIRAQVYTNYLSVFNFFTDFVNFSFIKKQNLIKQGNSKASSTVFSKK
jgi:hypothetical protein